jgi:8-oxo-dGTP pyrophosphatase MutT (NUDIX family)
MIDGERAADFVRRAEKGLRPDPPVLAEPGWQQRGDHAHDGVAARPDPPLLPARAGTPRPAAVLVPVVVGGERASVLFTERAPGLRSHSGQIAFPGGRIDPQDGTPRNAALREAEEEIGLDPACVRTLGYLDGYLSSSNYFVVPVIGILPARAPLRLNPHEVAACFEVPLAFLMDAANHEIHARRWQGRIRQYYAIPFGQHYIWGVTAGILRNMHERLYQS